MAKYDINIDNIETNEDGSKTASGTLDKREFEATSKETDDEGRELYKVGGSLEENPDFTRGERIAIARACRKAEVVEDEEISV